MRCSCPSPVVVGGQILSVSTCPICLPPGSIAFMMNNGKQLDLLKGVDTPEDLLYLDSVRSVSAVGEGEGDMKDQNAQRSRESGSFLPF